MDGSEQAVADLQAYRTLRVAARRPSSSLSACMATRTRPRSPARPTKCRSAQTHRGHPKSGPCRTTSTPSAVRSETNGAPRSLRIDPTGGSLSGRDRQDASPILLLGQGVERLVEAAERDGQCHVAVEPVPVNDAALSALAAPAFRGIVGARRFRRNSRPAGSAARGVRPERRPCRSPTPSPCWETRRRPAPRRRASTDLCWPSGRRRSALPPPAGSAVERSARLRRSVGPDRRSLSRSERSSRRRSPW